MHFNVLFFVVFHAESLLVPILSCRGWPWTCYRQRLQHASRNEDFSSRLSADRKIIDLG